MKLLMFLLLGILLTTPFIAQAQEEENDLLLNMTLDEEVAETANYAYAIGYVYVNVTEPPPQPFALAGLFTFEPFDFEGFVEDVMSFFGLS